MSTRLTATLADAFEVGKREGLKEALTEISNMLKETSSPELLGAYVKARLRSVNDLSTTNPFKTEDSNDL